MSKLKVFNDPLYGLINFPFELIYEVIDHRYFQRLRRIGQVGLSNLVYPGAVHTRFHHALGVAHLASELIKNLRLKGIEITDEEYEATCIAALVHDIGHGPFSHALEGQILPLHHEEITLHLIQLINKEMNGRLDLAISIFSNEYHKKYLHQILSGQVDVDRMDYLNRDSYYSGVAEGVIGYDRIIRMMHVHDGQLVVERKGLYSLEKFFIARYLMYRQVYMHKTAIAAEQMLSLYFEEYKKELVKQDHKCASAIDTLLLDLDANGISQKSFETFALLDDADIIMLLKSTVNSDNIILRTLSNGILNRDLFKVKVNKSKFSSDFVSDLRHKITECRGFPENISEKMIILGYDNSYVYDRQNEIQILEGEHLIPFSQLSEIEASFHEQIINYISFPRYNTAE